MFGNVGRRMGQKQKRENTEGATGLGRTREQTEERNQITTLIFKNKNQNAYTIKAIVDLFVIKT